LPRGQNLDIFLLPFLESRTVTMLYLIGLGLSDETDITVKGLEIVRKASRVYLEAYTSILLVNKTVLVPLPHTLQLQSTQFESRN
jgi:hypothetical protein